MKLTKVNFKGFTTYTDKGGTYFGIRVDFLNSLKINIYDRNSKKLLETIDVPESMCVGNVLSLYIKNFTMKDKCYKIFCDRKEYIDPYAKGILGLEEYGKVLEKSDLYYIVPENKEPKDFDKDLTLNIPFNESVFYEAHVRGLTMLDKTVAPEKRGTFEGVARKAKYLKELGVTGIVLLPSYEYIEREKEDSMIASAALYREKKSIPKINYWGFKEGFYFAPKASFAAGEDAALSFKSMVKALHSEGIEVIMLMYFPPELSDDFIKDVLRFWVDTYHVDGFRLVGVNIPVNFLTEDPFLKSTKLIFENIDYKSLIIKPGRFKNVGLISEMYVNTLRRFVKSDEDCISGMSYFIRENASGYAPIRNITDYSGFTLMDLVSYNKKHNEENHEDNTDGTSYNYSWNCGEEGISKKRSINQLRLKQVRNLTLFNMLCQGTPLLSGGDEWLNTANGNNNPYCQDNEIGWISYKKNAANKAFYEFTKNLIAFRKRHSILHQPKPLMLSDYLSCKYPDVSFHGTESFMMDQNPYSREFGVLFFGDYSRQYTKKTESSIMVLFNMNWEDTVFNLPGVSGEFSVKLLYATDGSTDESFDEAKAKPIKESSFKVSGRSIAILLLDRNKSKG